MRDPPGSPVQEALAEIERKAEVGNVGAPRPHPQKQEKDLLFSQIPQLSCGIWGRAEKFISLASCLTYLLSVGICGRMLRHAFWRTHFSLQCDWGRFPNRRSCRVFATYLHCLSCAAIHRVSHDSGHGSVDQAGSFAHRAYGEHDKSELALEDVGQIHDPTAQLPRDLGRDHVQLLPVDE